MKTVNQITIQLTIRSGKKTPLEVNAFVRGYEDRLIRINGFKKPVGALSQDLANKIKTILSNW